MRRYLNPRLISLLTIALATFVVAQDATTEPAKPATQESAPQTIDLQQADRSKIEAAIASYVAAFNAKDADGLVKHWSPDGVYISRSSGDRLSGHDKLKEEFTAILSGDNVPKLSVETESIEFVSPNVAIERGVAAVSSEDDVSETTYQVVYIKHDGEWLIDRVSEEEIFVRESNYEHLKGLEFLVGLWVHEGDGVSVEIDCQFTANENYLSRKYTVLADGEVQSSGLQIIGWDAKHEQIRSWLFDSDGGFVKGEWTSHDDEWVVQSIATLFDGASGSSTGIYRQVDADTIAWRKINRVLDGKLLPSTDEVTVRRQ